MKRIFIYVLICSTLAFLQQCTHDPLEVAPPGNSNNNNNNNNNPLPFNDTVCFQKQILPVIISSCAIAGCHDTATHASGATFTSYDIIRTYVSPLDTSSNSPLYYFITRTTSVRMPKPPYPPLDTSFIRTVKMWIMQGALNTSCAPPCGDTTHVTYDSTIRILLKNNCVPCHNQSIFNSNVKLDNYTDAKTAVLGAKVLCAINRSTGCSWMPKKSLKLSDCQIRKISIWAANNCPQ